MILGLIAQLVEQCPFKAWVDSSNLSELKKNYKGLRVAWSIQSTFNAPAAMPTGFDSIIQLILILLN